MEPAPQSVADFTQKVEVQKVEVPDGNAAEAIQKDTVKEPVPSPEQPAVDKSEKQEIAAETKKEETEEETLPPEVDGVQVPLYWHAKPCVHITSIGGLVTEEDLVPLFSKYGEIATISFENERHDAAVIRYENYSGNAEELLATVRQALNSTKLGDRTLIVEPFRPDLLLFIGNLTLDIDDALLTKMFEPHGKIERAFVLRNAAGRSKGYGFVEYSLKSQASTAKMTMGNINMDGRVLRVEWSDCRKVADMFSSVLFIDRLPRECLHIEQSLRSLFEKYGKVRDCHVAIGINQQYRGFAFIDFFHSTSADKAHQALDGYALEGSSIRVSFANPSKSAQSYKFRYGSEAAQAALGFIGKGPLASVPGMLKGPSRGPSPIPLMPSRFMSPARPGMVGMGIGMQFGRGSLDRGTVSPLLSSGTGMVGPGSGMVGRAPLLLGNMTPRAGMAVGGSLAQRMPFGQGAVSITPSAIAQVATAQAKAREEEAKARAEAAKQGVMRPVSTDMQSMDQYQRFPQAPQQNYYQQQQTAGSDQYKQPDSVYSYQQSYQEQSAPQPASLQSQYQPLAQQSQQSYSTQYYSTQQQQPEQSTQYSQHDGYYQQPTQQAQQYGYALQYGQLQYSQPPAQSYTQTPQPTAQQYQQATQQSQIAYTQQSYSEQYIQQQQQTQQQSLSGASVATASTGVQPVQDGAQQQAYSAYYQQQVQTQTQAGTAQVGSAATGSSTTSAAQQSYEAQWAAYYASQAAYQQQSATADVGQKRTADQMESVSQNQASYSYPGYSQQGMVAYQQQQQQSASATAAYQQNTQGAYQQQPSITTAVYQQQQASSVVPGYQQPGTAVSVAAGAGASYLPATTTGLSGYEQPMSSVADGYQQLAAAAPGTFQQVAMQDQAAGGVYDYSKRLRY